MIYSGERAPPAAVHLLACKAPIVVGRNGRRCLECGCERDGEVLYVLPVSTQLPSDCLYDSVKVLMDLSEEGKRQWRVEVGEGVL